MRIARPATSPIAAGGFRQRAFEAVCLLLVATCCLVLAWTQERGNDLLALRSGAVVVSSSSEYDAWPAMALLDDNAHTGWASHRGRRAPHTIVIELPQRFALESISFDNTRTQEIDYPGISARDVEIWLSTTSAADGFVRVATVEASQGGREQFALPRRSEARWVKLVVLSNWGNEEFTEIMELEAYGAPVGSVEEVVSVAGTYATNFGPLVLQQSGDRVRGCYDGGAASISGLLDGRLMRVRWEERSGSGSALLALSSGGELLNGLWYEGAELRGTWQGRRDADDPQPACEIDAAPWLEE
jgi:hypothetical protein